MRIMEWILVERVKERLKEREGKQRKGKFESELGLNVMEVYGRETHWEMQRAESRDSSHQIPCSIHESKNSVIGLIPTFGLHLAASTQS